MQKNCKLGIDQPIIEEEVQVQTESIEDGQESIVQTVTEKTVRGFFLFKKYLSEKPVFLHLFSIRTRILEF